uniref:uncharacterized protein LOC131104634 isoform X2 n=1 Tax=Doryrhamphus excisus TaxID=161450 RepID=UPI0025AE2B27|nr:uncharacterized protein LOC131104634 isoform X2 [Doryrhamphus excisus]
MQLVKSILTKKSGGEYIINEYNRTKTLADESRRKMVNILAADMTEKNGTSPPRQVKEMYARGIVSLFPYLRDPFSKNGYVEQDFALMFGEDVSGKFLEKWSTTFKKKIIQQCRTIPSTSELKELLLAADPSEDGDEVDIDYGHPLLLVLLMNFLRYTSCLRHHTTPCSTTCTRSSKPLCTTLMLANFMPT